jgi:hypothetical protein
MSRATERDERLSSKKKTMKSTAQNKEINGLLSRSEQLGFDGRTPIDIALPAGESGIGNREVAGAAPQ